MTHLISFPACGLSMQINRIAFSVLGKPIYWYGIIVCLGFLLGVWYVTHYAPRYGMTAEQVIDGVMLCTPLGFLCARIYYVVFEWSYYREHLGEIIAIWNGGIAIYGGVIGALLGLWWYSRRHKVSLWMLCDMAAPGLLIGQCIGRWGNFVNAEAHGGSTTLPWGMSIDGGTPVHPTFLYESLWTLLGFLLLHQIGKHRRFDGQLALLYVAWYGAGRAVIEGLRTDSLYWGTVRVSQALAVLSFLAAVAVLWWRSRQYGVQEQTKAQG